jgi:hydrogenase nickel incorporation protein HypA/HybF
MSIAQSLIQILQEEMAKHGAATLRSVRLSIGEMSAIVPESLSFCFEIITQGTPLEGAKLLMDRIPLKGYCPDCDRPFDIKDFVFICPTCGSRQVKKQISTFASKVTGGVSFSFNAGSSASCSTGST